MPGRPVVFDFVARDKNYSGGLRRMEQRTTSFAGTVGKIALRLAGPAALGAVGLAALKMGDTIDDATDTIRIKTGATGKTLKGLERDFKAVYARVPDDAAAAATAIGDLNVRTGQTGKGLQRLAEQELDLARITKTDLGENVAASTRLFRDWSIPTGKQASTLDEMFRASQATGIGITDLMTKVVQFGSPLRQLGFSLDQTTALFGEFERAGVVTETVLPGLKMALKNYALAHKDPQKALIETIRRIKESGTTAEANTIAFKTFGARAGPDLAAAIREGHLDLQGLIDIISGGKDTIATATQATDGWREKLTELWHQVEEKVGPAVADFLDNTVTRVGTFVTGTLNPALKTLQGWWDDNKTSIGDVAAALKDSFLPAADAATTSTDDLRTSGQKLGDQLIDVAIFAANLVKWWIDTRIQTTELMKATYDLIIGLGYAANAVDKLTGGTGHVADAMVRFGREGKKVAEGDLVKLKQSSKDTQTQLDKMHGRKLDIEGRDKVGPVARRIREELAALTGVLPGQVLKSTLRGGVRREAKGDIVGGPTIAMVGEGRAPETIIPWDPAYRRRALDLWTTTGRQLGVPGLAAGGIAGHLTDEVAALPALRTRMLALGRQFGGGFTGGAASGNVIRLALAQAKRMAASFKVALALIEAGIVESGLRNLPYGDRDSLGFLQQRPSQGWKHPMNISYASWDFLRRAFPIQGRYGTAGRLAQAVQRSAFPGRYDQQQARALGILHAYNYDHGGGLRPGLTLAMNNTGRTEPVGIDYDQLAAAMKRAGVGAVYLDGRRVDQALAGARIANAGRR